MISYWWALAIISGLGLATRNIFFKVANDKIDPALGAMVLSLAMGLTTIGYLVAQRTTTGQPLLSGTVTTQGIILSIVAGIGVAGANIFLAYAYKAGGQASLVALLQNGFAISLTVVIGVLFLQEVIKPLQILGMVTVGAGIYMIIRG